MSYNSAFGKAGETLLCALRRQLFGPDKIWPAMDWKTCTLICGGFENFHNALTASELGQVSLSDYRQRLQYQEQHVGT